METKDVKELINIMTKWEYRVISLSPNMPEIQKELNRMGQQGWELVSIFTHTGVYVEDGVKAVSEYFASFKKPV